MKFGQLLNLIIKEVSGVDSGANETQLDGEGGFMVLKSRSDLGCSLAELVAIRDDLGRAIGRAGTDEPLTAGEAQVVEAFLPPPDDVLGVLKSVVREHLSETGEPLSREDLAFLHATIIEAARLIDGEPVQMARHSHRNNDTGLFHPVPVPAARTGLFTPAAGSAEVRA